MAKKTFDKITVGFVIQEYQTEKDGSHTPIRQEFIACDQVDYEDTNGEPIEVDTLKETYCPFEMVQPTHRPFPPSREGLKFICPDCKGTELECVMEGGYSSIVTVISEDGEFEFDNSFVESDLSHYQCNCCGKRLMYPDDCDAEYEIQDDEKIVEWIKLNCPQD